MDDAVKQKGVWTGIAAVGAAILGSSCCWLPLLLLTLGVGGATLAGVTSTMEELRWLFAGVAVFLLGAAFYLTYRKPRSAPAGGAREDCCAPIPKSEESCCPPTVSKIQKVNRVILPLVAVLVIATVLFPETVIGALVPTQKAGKPEASTNPSEGELVLKISGMT